MIFLFYHISYLGVLHSFHFCFTLHGFFKIITDGSRFFSKYCKTCKQNFNLRYHFCICFFLDLLLKYRNVL